MEGKFRLAWQKGRAAIYAEILIDVQEFSGNNWLIERSGEIDASWSIGIQFGIELFRKNFSSQYSSSNFHIRIIQLLGQPVDTTITSLAYVTFHALGNALNIDTAKIFEFDEANGSFTIKLLEV